MRAAVGLVLALALGGCAETYKSDAPIGRGERDARLAAEESIEGEARYNARLVVERYEELGAELDYSVDSLAVLERGFADATVDVENESADELYAIGEYVGEVIRRATGGEWGEVLGSEDDPRPTLTLPDGTVVRPIEAARDRFSAGPAESLQEFGERIVTRSRIRLERMRRDARTGRLRAIETADARMALETMLDAAGVDREAPAAIDVGRAWAVFERLARVRATDAESDDLLFQHGVYDFFNEGDAWELDLTRQFAMPDERLLQLSMTFRFALTPALESLPEASVWSSDVGRRGFFRRARLDRGFRAASGLDPLSMRIIFEDVE